MSISYSLDECDLSRLGAGREEFASWRKTEREPMTDQTKPEGKPPGRRVTQAKLEVEDWCVGLGIEFDDDDPNPPPIRGRSPPKPCREVSFLKKLKAIL